jgi:hypothetical protein
MEINQQLENHKIHIRINDLYIKIKKLENKIDMLEDENEDLKKDIIKLNNRINNIELS